MHLVAVLAHMAQLSAARKLKRADEKHEQDLDDLNAQHMKELAVSTSHFFNLMRYW